MTHIITITFVDGVEVKRVMEMEFINMSGMIKLPANEKREKLGLKKKRKK